MDNNNFYNNGSNEDPDQKPSEQDIFAEETQEQDSDIDKSQNGPVLDSGSTEQGRPDSYGMNGNRDQGCRVNPDQWQAYRQSQNGGNRNNSYGPYGQTGPGYGPYGQTGPGYGPDGQNAWNNGNEYPQNPYQPYNGYYQQDPSRGFGIASMVLGIISLLCFCSFVNVLPAILSIVFGIISLSKRKNNGFAIAGIICAAVSIVLLVITMILFADNINLTNALQDYLNNYESNFYRYIR